MLISSIRSRIKERIENRFSSDISDDFLLWRDAFVIYSLRKFPFGVSRACRVVRESDLAELDIGFSGAGLDVAALETFCAGTNGFVKTLYNQRGSVHHAQQATFNSMPKIFDSTSGVVLEGGRPAFEFDGTDDYMIVDFAQIFSQPNSISMVSTKTDYSSDSYWYDGIIDTHRNALYRNHYIYSGSTLYGYNSNTAQESLLAVYNGVDTSIYQNGVQLVAGDAGTNGLTGLTIGCRDIISSFHIGTMQELVFFNADKEDSSLDFYENQEDYYKIQ